jgi:hypothetical protein
MSISMTSGRCLRAVATASRPSAASATARMPGIGLVAGLIGIPARTRTAFALRAE